MKTNLGPGQRGPNIKLELDSSFGPVISSTNAVNDHGRLFGTWSLTIFIFTVHFLDFMSYVNTD